MFILDIETSGLDESKHGIVEVAAIKYENTEIFYHSLCRLDQEDEIDDIALKINGQTREQVRDPKRRSQEKVLKELYDFVKKENDFYISGENVAYFDMRFIMAKSKRYGLQFPFHRRSYDLHTAATLRYEQIYGKIPITNGENELWLSKILDFVGIIDERKVHSAIDDCKLEGEAISRIRNGKNLFQEYSQFPIPDYLKR